MVKEFFERLSCSLQLWCIENQNKFFHGIITTPLLGTLYYADFVAYSMDPKKFLLHRREIMGNADNFASLGRIILGDHALVSESIMAPQNRPPYLGRVELVPEKVADDFLLFLSDADVDGEGKKHKAIHDYFWEVVVPDAEKRVAADPDAFATYVAALSDGKETPSEDVQQKMVVKYIFHSLSGSVPEDDMVDCIQQLFFTGGSSMYHIGAIKLPFLLRGLLWKGSGKRRELIKKAVDFILASPSMEKFEPVVGIEKDDFGELMLAILGIAGCLGTEGLVSNILDKIPADYKLKDINDKREVMMTVLEAARIKAPVNTVNFRLAEESKTIKIHFGKEFTMRKGTLCGASIGLASHDPIVFENPEKFDPQRDNLMKAILNFNHVGFSPTGSGTRQCPGRNLAVKFCSDLLIALQQNK
ncbi:MAG: hypothetical protein SGBAC_010781 [Bacillariaceae sp.]